jgi:hypothetical protein
MKYILVHKNDHQKKYENLSYIRDNMIGDFYLLAYKIDHHIPEGLAGYRKLSKSEILETRASIENGEKFIERNEIRVKQDAFLDPGQRRARFTGLVTGVVNSVGSHSFDFQLAENRYITGVEVFADAPAHGDSIDFQVVHPLAGVLDQFGTGWYMSSGTKTYNVYPAYLPQGLIVRVIYNATTNNQVCFSVNGFLHKP